MSTTSFKLNYVHKRGYDDYVYNEINYNDGLYIVDAQSI